MLNIVVNAPQAAPTATWLPNLIRTDTPPLVPTDTGPP
ncbi:hypothetical protein BTZ20_1152 [Rhodococcus sp. MTM3W5.2]|nr:hypothetical protein BTZ20_1152 [Rhodococcus sp. MTM3W5.2]